jgi:hypothetical protein
LFTTVPYRLLFHLFLFKLLSIFLCAEKSASLNFESW